MSFWASFWKPEALGQTVLPDRSSLIEQKLVILASFLNEAYGQTVLPDRSILIRQKILKSAKIEKFKWDILSNCSRALIWCWALNWQSTVFFKARKWDFFMNWKGFLHHLRHHFLGRPPIDMTPSVVSAWWCCNTFKSS